MILDIDYDFYNRINNRNWKSNEQKDIEDLFKRCRFKKVV